MTAAEWLPASCSDLPERFTVRRYVQPPRAVWSLQQEAVWCARYEHALTPYSVHRFADHRVMKAASELQARNIPNPSRTRARPKTVNP